MALEGRQERREARLFLPALCKVAHHSSCSRSPWRPSYSAGPRSRAATRWPTTATQVTGPGSVAGLCWAETWCKQSTQPALPVPSGSSPGAFACLSRKASPPPGTPWTCLLLVASYLPFPVVPSGAVPSQEGHAQGQGEEDAGRLSFSRGDGGTCLPWSQAAWALALPPQASLPGQASTGCLLGEVQIIRGPTCRGFCEGVAGEASRGLSRMFDT